MTLPGRHRRGSGAGALLAVVMLCGSTLPAASAEATTIHVIRGCPKIESVGTGVVVRVTAVEVDGGPHAKLQVLRNYGTAYEGELEVRTRRDKYYSIQLEKHGVYLITADLSGEMPPVARGEAHFFGVSRREDGLDVADAEAAWLFSKERGAEVEPLFAAAIRQVKHAAVRERLIVQRRRVRQHLRAVAEATQAASAGQLKRAAARLANAEAARDGYAGPGAEFFRCAPNRESEVHEAACAHLRQVGGSGETMAAARKKAAAIRAARDVESWQCDAWSQLEPLARRLLDEATAAEKSDPERAESLLLQIREITRESGEVRTDAERRLAALRGEAVPWEYRPRPPAPVVRALSGLSGRVLDPRGLPVIDVEVRIDHDVAPRDSRAKTDRSGVFRFPRVQRKTIRISLDSLDWEADPLEVEPPFDDVVIRARPRP